MKVQENILLPGLNEQLEFLFETTERNFESILVVGASGENISRALSQKFGVPVELIVPDYESLLNSKLILHEEDTVNVKLMDYENTDYGKNLFDLVYAQASISSTNRKSILKEIKRILKPDGFLCLGEIVKLKSPIPPFVQNVFDSSDLLPLNKDEVSKYFVEKNFKIIDQRDLTNTLKTYYTSASNKLGRLGKNLTEDEKKYYKKLINKISHETNVYLKLGGDKFIGFTCLLLQKEAK